MVTKIRPSPTAQEREAILMALARQSASPYASRWRRAGLDYAIARPGPRSSRGAERA